MTRIKLPGGSYTSQSVNVDAQSTVNWYPERVESGDGSSDLVLYPTPGIKTFINPKQDATGGIPVFEQGNAGSNAYATHTPDYIDVPFTSPNKLGSVIVVVLNVGTGQIGVVNFSVSDTNLNTYYLIGQSADPGLGGGVVTVWIAANVAAGANTVHVANEGNLGEDQNSDMDVAIHEYSGCMTTSTAGVPDALDQKNLQYNNYTVPSLTGTVTTLFANEMAVSWCATVRNGGTIASAAGWIPREYSLNVHGEALQTADISAVATGPYSNSWTPTATTDTNAGILTLKGVVGTGGCVPS